MYKVRIETRMDILGNVIDRFNMEIPYEGQTKKDVKLQAEKQAHDEKCQSYGMPVHFKAISVTKVF